MTSLQTQMARETTLSRAVCVSRCQSPGLPGAGLDVHPGVELADGIPDLAHRPALDDQAVPQTEDMGMPDRRARAGLVRNAERVLARPGGVAGRPISMAQQYDLDKLNFSS